MNGSLNTRFTRQVKVALPIICGAMYPCSNIELVAAVSAHGGLGIVQPLSLIYVRGQDLRKTLQTLRYTTDKPYGMNILVEASSTHHKKRMQSFVQIAIEEGCRFFSTALGNPQWVVEMVKPYGALVYHDVTERKWAEKALKSGVDGLICVNNRAGGHVGALSSKELFSSLKDLQVPLICAGGIGDPADFTAALQMGYDGVQMGTRFIATVECQESLSYKEAICHATEADIVLTERVTGIPLSVIRTPYVEAVGTKAGPVARWLLRHAWSKKWMRIWYGFWAMRHFKKISLSDGSSISYWQAGKSAAHIEQIETVASLLRRFAAACR